MPVVFAVSVLLVTAACGGSGSSEDGGPDERFPVGQGFTSDQLEKALLPALAGYQRAGDPETGEFGTLKAIRNFDQLQRSVRLDKPECLAATRAVASAKGVADAPAALATFNKGYGQTVSETLIGVRTDFAEKQVTFQVPAACRTFRTRVSGKWATHRVVEAAHGDIGAGSRTVGVATTSGGAQVKTWYVVLRSRGYLATITVFGANATRAEAEQVARQAYDRAERILQ